MDNRIIIACLVVGSTHLLTLHGQRDNQTSRVIIYNNHKITQTVTSSNEYNTTPNRYPGHTKDETTTQHRVDIAPLAPQSDSSNATMIIDNAHAINQTATHTTTRTHSIDPHAMQSRDNAQSNLNSSWFAAFIPPIIAQSSTIQYFLGAVGLSYAVVMTKLLHSSYFVLNKKDTWSSWQADIAIETMHSDEKQFAQDLFAALQSRYINAPINACFLSPLVHFINDVDTELAQLTTFISLHKAIKKFNFMFMFPKQEDELRIAHEKIRRLEYYKTIIINWVGEYKV